MSNQISQEEYKVVQDEVAEVMNLIGDIVTGRSLTVAINSLLFVLGSAVAELEAKEDVEATMRQVSAVMLDAGMLALARLKVDTHEAPEVMQ